MKIILSQDELEEAVSDYIKKITNLEANIVYFLIDDDHPRAHSYITSDVRVDVLKEEKSDMLV